MKYRRKPIVVDAKPAVHGSVHGYEIDYPDGTHGFVSRAVFEEIFEPLPPKRRSTLARAILGLQPDGKVT